MKRIFPLRNDKGSEDETDISGQILSGIGGVVGYASLHPPYIAENWRELVTTTNNEQQTTNNQRRQE